ncbi:hypothetical protein FQA39_LY02145 [Lamprigera yunnana]|nr:hypothetical protein FQA39_LY02145 [Lamprigera yunnana]
MMKTAEQILSNNEEFNNVNQNVTDEDKNELPVCASSHHLDQERFDILNQVSKSDFYLIFLLFVNYIFSKSNPVVVYVKSLFQNNKGGDSNVEQLSTRSNVDQEENGFLENTEWPGEYANATQQNQRLASVDEIEKFIHEEDADDSIKDKDYEPNFSDVSLEEISEPEVAPQNFVNKSNNERRPKKGRKRKFPGQDRKTRRTNSNSNKPYYSAKSK